MTGQTLQYSHSEVCPALKPKNPKVQVMKLVAVESDKVEQSSAPQILTSQTSSINC